MTEKQLKVDRVLWTMAITIIMFLALGEVWMWLEMIIFGEVRNNPVDNIISIPILISFWFNARNIVSWIHETGK